jgi:hypothetical protein
MFRKWGRGASLIAIAITAIALPADSLAAGRSTSQVVNTILNGKGAPKNSLGINGDFYIDVRSLLFYGPKSRGKWPAPQNLQGPTGSPGSDGKNGVDGKSSALSTVSAATGPKGDQGEKGDKGEKGDPGAPGAAGPSGGAGPIGPAGPPGPSGPMGPAGSNGSNGANGAIGATGPQGATGARGETGTTGPSEVTVINVPEFTLQSSIGYTYIASEVFGSLRANNSYRFEIYIRANSGNAGVVLGADIVGAGGAIQFDYIRADSRHATYSTALASYGFLITGTIAVGATDSAIAVRVIDAYGLTGTNPLTFTGKAYITLVGAIR